jgi:hypothetical protein
MIMIHVPDKFTVLQSLILYIPVFIACSIYADTMSSSYILYLACIRISATIQWSSNNDLNSMTCVIWCSTLIYRSHIGPFHLLPDFHGSPPPTSGFLSVPCIYVVLVYVYCMSILWCLLKMTSIHGPALFVLVYLLAPFMRSVNYL